MYENGKGQTRRNIVSIQDGKGIKAVEVYTADGSQVSRKELPITAKEMECIQKNKFIPGLFKDCIHMPNQPKKSLTRPKRTVRHKRNK
jgi:hypothetical protein